MLQVLPKPVKIKPLTRSQPEAKTETKAETTPAAAPVRPRSRRPHIVLTAQNLAKASRSKGELTCLAAGYVRGGVTVTQPTIALASRIFGVSHTAIKTALDELEQDSVATPAIDGIWVAVTPAERADFVKTHLAEIWRLVDVATA